MMLMRAPGPPASSMARRSGTAICPPNSAPPSKRRYPGMFFAFLIQFRANTAKIVLVGLPGTVLESARIVAVSLEVAPGCTVAVHQAGKRAALHVVDTPAGKMHRAAGAVGTFDSLPAPGQRAGYAQQSNR